MCSIEDTVATFEVTKYDSTKNAFITEKKLVTVEKCYEVRLNGKFFRRVFCSPSDLEDLAVGIIAQEEIFAAAQTPISYEVKFAAKDLLACADKLLSELSSTHDKTNGVHSGILFDGRETLLFREDIGRHNVFDKIFGAALQQGIFLGDKALIFSGRCSSEMMIKLYRMKIPVVVAKSVPTTYSINLAKKFGITLAGRLRADSFCIYTNPQRIIMSNE